MGKINQLDRYIARPAGTSLTSQKVMTATIEAIIGAAYLDGGINAAETVVQNLGINALEGTIPRASFNLRTRWPYVRKPIFRSTAASRK